MSENVGTDCLPHTHHKALSFILHFVPACLQAAEVRMASCSHLYLTTVLLQHQQMARAVGLNNLLYAAACSAASDLARDTRCASSTQLLCPGWFASARPASGMQLLVIDWHVPLRDLHVLVEQCMRDGDGAQLRGSCYTWQGANCRITLEVEEDSEEQDSADATAGGRPVCIGCYIQLHSNEKHLCKVVCEVFLMHAGSMDPEDAVTCATIDSHIGRGTESGHADFVYSGRTITWQDVEQRLRADDVVHADGCLHIRAVVSKLH
jgi:hypothetical protein